MLPDRLIPETIKKDASQYQYLMAQRAIGVSLIATLSGVTYTIVYFLIGHYIGGIIITLGVFLELLIVLFATYRSYSILVYSNITTGIVFCIQFSLSYTTNGLLAPNTMWFVFVPIIGIFTGGVLIGVIWGGLSLLTIVFFYILEIRNFIFPSHPLLENQLHLLQAIGTLGLILFILGLSMIYEIIGKYGYDQLEIKKVQIEGLAKKLAKYLSPQLSHSIIFGEKDVKIETYRKKLTIFFSDIHGFTELTDSLESETLTDILNTYLTEMSRIALKYGATIDKFIGDGMMLFFGDPNTKGVKEDALACVLMAIEMREHMKYLRQKWNEQGLLKTLRIRIGINTGYCTVGNFGSEDRLDYTIIGGQVNLASRLESNAEPDQILIAHETYALIKNNILCEKKSEIRCKGITYPVQAYQVVEPIDNLMEQKINLKEEFDGFYLLIDLNKVDKVHVIDSLKNMIKKLNIC